MLFEGSIALVALVYLQLYCMTFHSVGNMSLTCVHVASRDLFCPTYGGFDDLLLGILCRERFISDVSSLFLSVCVNGSRCSCYLCVCESGLSCVSDAGVFV